MTGGGTEMAGLPSVRSWSWHAGKGSAIWQLVFPGEGVVAGLKRYPALRAASLFALDAASGTPLCEGFVPVVVQGGETPVGDGWMIGLESVCRGLVYCHGFQAGSPEHQGIWAVDPVAGRVVWGRPEAVFAANLDSSLLVYRNRMFAGFPEREYWLIDPSTGGVLEALGTGHDRPNLLRMTAADEESRQGIRLSGTALSPNGPVERIDAGTCTVEAGHRPSAMVSGAWCSTLRVRFGEQTLYEAEMAVSSPAPLFNNFLVRGHMLYYIRENEHLVGVELP